MSESNQRQHKISYAEAIDGPRNISRFNEHTQTTNRSSFPVFDTNHWTTPRETQHNLNNPSNLRNRKNKSRQYSTGKRVFTMKKYAGPKSMNSYNHSGNLFRRNGTTYIGKNATQYFLGGGKPTQGQKFQKYLQGQRRRWEP